MMMKTKYYYYSFMMMMGLLVANPVYAAQHHTQDWLDLINQARSQGRQCGNQFYPAAPPLKWNATLEKASQNHADDMAKNQYFSHQGRDGSSPFQRLERLGYRFWTAAENISAGRATAEQAMSGWLKSAGHCANIMNPDVQEVGMAMAHNPSSRFRYYWVQNFGRGR